MPRYSKKMIKSKNANKVKEEKRQARLRQEKEKPAEQDRQNHLGENSKEEQNSLPQKNVGEKNHPFLQRCHQKKIGKIKNITRVKHNSANAVHDNPLSLLGIRTVSAKEESPEILVSKIECQFDAHKFIETIYKGYNSNLLCDHYKVRASSVHSLLLGSLNFEKIHHTCQFPFITGRGKIAERQVALEYNLFSKQESYTNSRYAFLTSTPDMLINTKHGITCVEVKSSKKGVWSGFYNVRHILQLLTTMMTINGKEGLMICLTENKVNQTIILERKYKIHVKIEVDLFSFPDFKNLLIDKYLLFLRSFLVATSRQYTEEDFVFLKKKLLEHSNGETNSKLLEKQKIKTCCSYFSRRVINEIFSDVEDSCDEENPTKRKKNKTQIDKSELEMKYKYNFASCYDLHRQNNYSEFTQEERIDTGTNLFPVDVRGEYKELEMIIDLKVCSDLVNHSRLPFISR